MNSLSFIKKIITIFLFLITTVVVSEEYAIIVNISNKDSDIRSHFLLFEEKLSNGAKTIAFEIDTKDNSKKEKVKKVFLEKVLKMSLQQYQQHWLNRKAAGKTVKPTSVKTYRSVKQYVQRKKGGIGYIPKKLAGGNVKIAAIFKVN